MALRNLEGRWRLGKEGGEEGGASGGRTGLSTFAGPPRLGFPRFWPYKATITSIIPSCLSTQAPTMSPAHTIRRASRKCLCSPSTSAFPLVPACSGASAPSPSPSLPSTSEADSELGTLGLGRPLPTHRTFQGTAEGAGNDE